jgi:hypothetical protein
MTHARGEKKKRFFRVSYFFGCHLNSFSPLFLPTRKAIGPSHHGILMGARSLFMKRGSGSTPPVVVAPSGGAPRAEQSQSQSQSQSQQQQQQHYGTVAAAENEEELLMEEQSLALSQRRNPIAKAMGSSIGLLASVGLLIYGFGMVLGHREAILERWRMASSP